MTRWENSFTILKTGDSVEKKRANALAVFLAKTLDFDVAEGGGEGETEQYDRRCGTV